MARKLILAVLLLLFTGVQAQTASCGVRCSIMEASMSASLPGASSQDGAAMAHCHGMSLKYSNGASGKAIAMASNNSCGVAVCNTEWVALLETGSHSLDSYIFHVDAPFAGTLLKQIAEAQAVSALLPQAAGSGAISRQRGSVLRI